MKNIKTFEKFISSKNEMSIEDFMKKYPVGTTLKTTVPNGEYTRKITNYNPKDENSIICDIYDPNGKLWKKDSFRYHRPSIQLYQNL